MAGVGDVARKAGVSFDQASKVFDAVCDLMKEMGPEDKITIQGLGTFRLRARNPRTARNPADADAGPVDVEAKVIPDIDFNRTFRTDVADACKEHLPVLLAKRNKTSVDEEMEKLGIKPKKGSKKVTKKDEDEDEKPVKKSSKDDKKSGKDDKKGKK